MSVWLFYLLLIAQLKWNFTLPAIGGFWTHIEREMLIVMQHKFTCQYWWGERHGQLTQPVFLIKI